MECKSIETLRQEGLPPNMPAATEIGVWKRSTGYEVILPYRLGWLNWLLLGAGLVILVGSVFPLAHIFSIATPMGQAILYTVLVVPVLGYMLFLSFKLSQTRSTKIRIDMTPLNMTFTLVEPSGVARKFNDIPVNQIEDVCLYKKRGIRINGNIAGTHFGVWTGRGLKSDDLYYLMCVIGKATLLSAQTNNPREPVIKEDIGHIELG
jgi:hypothetical protein